MICAVDNHAADIGSRVIIDGFHGLDIDPRRVEQGEIFAEAERFLLIDLIFRLGIGDGYYRAVGELIGVLGVNIVFAPRHHLSEHARKSHYRDKQDAYADY